MTIPALPAAPSPTDTPAEFNTKAFAFLAALDPWGDAADALAVTMDGYADAAIAAAASADTDAGTATTQAGIATTKAGEAAASAVTAGNAATSAAASFDSFDDRYLGAKTSDPSLDNDGNALITGALYFNSSVGEMRVRTAGGTWVAAYIPASGYLTTGDIGSTVQAYDADLTTWAGKTAPSGTVVGTSDSQTLTAKTIEAGTFTNGYTEEVATANTSTAYTIDLANGSIQILTLTGNCTFTFPTAAAGKSFIMLLKQDGTGSRTATWPSAVKWPAGTAPTITSTASKLDKYIFTSDGTNWYGSDAGKNYTV
jgi:hypothetical protein